MRKFYVAAIAMVAAFVSAGGASAQTATQDINLSATVTSYCTIGGSTSPAALSDTIPVSAAGVVTTTAINHTIASVVCNNVTNVLATSLTGAVKLSGAAPSGSSDIIDYTASATFNSATSNLDTATTPTATSSEAGSLATTTGAGSGNLTVSITPVQPALPLAPGGYSDTLRVTLTAQ